MLTLRIQMFEFLDALPQANVPIEARVRVVPTFPGFGGINSTTGKPNPDVPKRDDSLAIIVGGSGVTDAHGRAAIQVALEDAIVQAMAQVQGQLTAMTVVFDYALRAEVLGADLGWTPPIGFLSKDDTIDKGLVIDLATSIVGDTSSAHTTLWFQLHFPPRAGDVYTCELRPIGQPNAAPLIHPIQFDPARAMTCVTTFLGLSPATNYGYILWRRAPSGETNLVTQGRVRTIAANPTKMTIEFASCHQPSNDTALNRWAVLSRRTEQDMLILLGDQIYGDSAPKMFPATRIGADGKEHPDWPIVYEQRYNQQFAYQPMRNAMRTRPVYMMLDDHDVVDDWGLDRDKHANDADYLAREAAALRAYDIFQQAHNPGGANPPHLDYHFKRGAACFYVTDNRTGRGWDPNHPVLGQAQVQRLRQWARSSEVLDSDLVFLVVPVPPAMLPIAAMQKLAHELAPALGATAGGLAGMIVGGLVGLLVAGPPGAAYGALGAGSTLAALGLVGAEPLLSYYEDTITEPDIRDAWTYDDNLPDLTNLLDIAFDIANDIQGDGRPGPKPKGVFLLCGDYHYGAVHSLMSNRKSDGHDHRNNPTLLQITSSPISAIPLDSDMMDKILDTIDELAVFPLDGHYVAKQHARLMERNFGRFSFEKSGPGRRYRIQFAVEGQADALTEMFELDLDARPVKMRNMIGDIIATRGKITMLRATESGYGPPADRIETEIVIQLDSEPGRAFGFELKRDRNLPARRRSLALLRDAFAHDRTVLIDYRRTGEKNGVIVRVSALTE